MIFEDIHQAKYDLIDKGLPSDLVLDFGSTFRPRYIEHASKNGAKNCLSIDYQKGDFPKGVEFEQMDFSKDRIVQFLDLYREKTPGKCLGLMYDILLHQYGPLHVLHNLLSTVDHVCLGNPVLKEGGDPCIFLPSVPEDEQGELFPISWLGTELETQDECRFVAEDRYTTANWLWGLNAKLLKTWVRRQNFDIIEEITVDRPHAWSWWGCYAVKKPSN